MQAVDDELGKIKVLLFTSVLGGGGAERQVVRLANTLDKDLFDVSVGVARGGGSYEQELDVSTRYYPLTARLRSSTLSMICSVPGLRRLITEERPHIVCSFLEHAHVAAALAVFGLPRPPHLVMCVQNTLSEKRGSESYIGLLTLFAAARARRRARKIIALSHGVATDLVEHEGLPHSRIDIAYNSGPIPERTLHPGDALPRRHPGELVIVTCGRLVPQKDYSTLLNAFAIVRAQTPARLWLIGEGPQRYELEELATRLGIREAIEFLGFVPYPERFMQAADLFALSSVFEGFGNVLVESLSVGTPIVSTDCPHGPAEIIGSSGAGLLVPPQDPGALAREMLRVLQNPELRNWMSEEALIRAEVFSPRATAASYARAFRSIVC